MKRANDIVALLKRSNYIFTELKQEYEVSLKEQKIRDDLRVDIKNIFENLRSCLDYMARDIFETCCASSPMPDTLYFPICTSLSDFKRTVSSRYPELQKTNKQVYGILEQVQPYHESWLSDFNKLNNQNKHQNLVEQTKTESRTVTISNGESSVEWGPGVSFGGGVSILGVPIDPKTQLPVPNNQVKTDIVIWVDFLFKDNGLSVLPFIEKSLTKIEHIFQELQKFI